MLSWNDYFFEQEKQHDYSCLMALLPEDLSKDLISWGKSFISKHDLYTGESGMGLETDPHVTVLYGLHTTQPNKIKTLLTNQKPVKLILGRTSLFDSNSNYDVVKLSVKSEDLVDLNSLLRDKCAYTTDYEKYVPHCTIAYVKKGRGKKYSGNDTFNKVSVITSELLFSSSDGTKTQIKL